MRLNLAQELNPTGELLGRMYAGMVSLVEEPRTQRAWKNSCKDLDINAIDQMQAVHM